jgi:hypothetical protein
MSIVSILGVLPALAFAPALTSVHPAGETALDTATIEAITEHPGALNTEAAEQLLEVVRTYLK